MTTENSLPVPGAAIAELLGGTRDEIDEMAKRTGYSRFPSPEQLRGWRCVIDSAIHHLAAPAPAGAQHSQGTLEWALDAGGVLAAWCNVASDALHALMAAYERRVRSACDSPEQLAQQPWRCAEFVQAEDALRSKPIWTIEIPRLAKKLAATDLPELPRPAGKAILMQSDQDEFLFYTPAYSADQLHAYAADWKHAASVAQAKVCELQERRVAQEALARQQPTEPGAGLPVAWYVFADTEHWVTLDKDEAERNRDAGCHVRPMIFGDAALARQQSRVVDRAMAKRAEEARVNCLRAVTAYGSAGVEERHEMAMEAALRAALEGARDGR